MALTPDFDFASMEVGEQRDLQAGKWDVNLHLYEQCLEYVRSVTPHPQFEFDCHRPIAENGWARWFIRRIR